MSTTTPNIKLTKPELTDPADITALNQNWEVIDKKLADALYNSGTQTINNGNLILQDSNGPNNRRRYAIEYNSPDGTIEGLGLYIGNTGGSLFVHEINGSIDNYLRLGTTDSQLLRPLNVASGGTGANTLSGAKTNLGISTLEEETEEIQHRVDILNDTVLSHDLNLKTLTGANLTTVPIQQPLNEFDYFVGYFTDESTGVVEKITYNHITFDDSKLEYVAKAYTIRGTILHTWTLKFYWGDGGFMVDSTKSTFDINTGSSAITQIPFVKLVGFRVLSE